MRMINLLKGTYDWVENLDEVLDVESDPYFTLISKETKKVYKTIYMGCEDNYLIFEYYVPCDKDRDCISFDTDDILEEKYEFYKQNKLFDITNVINKKKSLNLSSLRKGEVYKLIFNLKEVKNVIYLGYNEKRLAFAYFNPWLNGIENFYLREDEVLKNYCVYELE